MSKNSTTRPVVPPVRRLDTRLKSREDLVLLHQLQRLPGQLSVPVVDLLLKLLHAKLLNPVLLLQMLEVEARPHHRHRLLLLFDKPPLPDLRSTLVVFERVLEIADRLVRRGKIGVDGERRLILQSRSGALQRLQGERDRGAIFTLQGMDSSDLPVGRADNIGSAALHGDRRGLFVAAEGVVEITESGADIAEHVESIHFQASRGGCAGQREGFGDEGERITVAAESQQRIRNSGYGRSCSRLAQGVAVSMGW